MTKATTSSSTCAASASARSSTTPQTHPVFGHQKVIQRGGSPPVDASAGLGGDPIKSCPAPHPKGSVFRHPSEFYEHTGSAGVHATAGIVDAVIRKRPGGTFTRDHRHRRCCKRGGGDQIRPAGTTRHLHLGQGLYRLGPRGEHSGLKSSRRTQQLPREPRVRDLRLRKFFSSAVAMR